jgi:hypothetical protein
MENVLQELSQLATLAGLLGGFGFTAIIQLLSIERKGKVITATIMLFALSTLMFLLALLMFILTFSAATELGNIPKSLDNLGAYGVLVTFGAVFILESGIGLSGWIRSKAAGIAASILAVIAICLTGVIIISVIRNFT